MVKSVKTKTVSRTPGKGLRDEPYLIILSGGVVGMMYHLRPDAATLIGRGLDVDVRVEDEGVSRKHAKVTVVENEGPILEDLGSSNGTFVNGAEIKRHVLKDGDKVQVGSNSILKFSYQDELERDFQEHLFDRGIKDGLTGLYNKKYFLDRIDSDYAHAQRHDTSLALLLFDIDHFKKINDTYGHPAGDSVLKKLTRIVRKTLRTADIFARYGGDEFIVLMRNVDDAGALVLAQRIRGRIKKQEFVFEDTRIPVTVSLGIGTLSDNVNNAAELVQVADKYLYKAKQAGRNCIGGRVTKTAAQANWSIQTVKHDSGKRRRKA